jgi:hypothetical protein
MKQSGAFRQFDFQNHFARCPLLILAEAFSNSIPSPPSLEALRVFGGGVAGT